MDAEIEQLKTESALGNISVLRLVESWLAPEYQLKVESVKNPVLFRNPGQKKRSLQTAILGNKRTEGGIPKKSAGVVPLESKLNSNAKRIVHVDLFGSKPKKPKVHKKTQ